MPNATNTIITNVNDTRFRLDSPSVIFERFDDEVIAIHLDTGTYHSMTGAAADTFVLLSEEATIAELAEALSAKYDATGETIAQALAPFFEQLQKEQLIVEARTPKPRGPLKIGGSKTGLPFVPPTVDAYHDLENLLLLDPIHEVGDEGWPQPSGPVTQ